MAFEARRGCALWTSRRRNGFGRSSVIDYRDTVFQTVRAGTPARREARNNRAGETFLSAVSLTRLFVEPLAQGDEYIAHGLEAPCHKTYRDKSFIRAYTTSATKHEVSHR